MALSVKKVFRKFHCSYRNTSKKMWTAMVSIKQIGKENFDKPREATVKVFEDERTIVFTYTPGSLTDRLILQFYEIQNTAALSAAQFLLQLENEEEIQMTFGSPNAMVSFNEAITLVSSDSDSGNSESISEPQNNIG